MRSAIRIILPFFLILLMSTPVTAQNVYESSGGLFGDDEVLELTLEADLNALLHDVGEENDEHPAIIKYRSVDGSLVSLILKVETRGGYRRDPDHCDFPPLRLNFPKKSLDETLFEGQDKIKLVTHCQSTQDVYEQYLFQEYLIYRLYNILTEKSFLVRLVHLTYVDITDTFVPITKYAFLIEDIDRMAERNGAEFLDEENVPSDKLDDEPLELLYLFEYLIGNIDWNVQMQQNLRLIAADRNRSIVAVPYDFDLVRLINPIYADRAPDVGPSSLRHQLFNDFCRSPDDIASILQNFNAHREAIYTLYQTFPLLQSEYVKRTLRHFDRFYQTINDPQLIEREFIKPCRVQ